MISSKNKTTRRIKRSLNAVVRSIALRPERSTRVMVIVLFYLCIAMAVLYVYFLGSAVMHAAMRKEAESNLTELSYAVGQMEAEYFKAQSELVPEKGEALGLAAIANKSFADRTIRVGVATGTSKDF
jgi:hypothetical protein